MLTELTRSSRKDGEDSVNQAHSIIEEKVADSVNRAHSDIEEKVADSVN